MNERLAFNAGAPYVNGQRGPAAARSASGALAAPLARGAEPPRAGASAGAGARRRPVVDWAWRGALMFTFVTFFRPQDQIKPLVMLHLAELSALLGIGALVLGRLGRRLPISRVTPEILGVVFFFLALVASVPTSTWPGGSVHTLTDVVVKLFLIFILLVNTVDSRRRLDQLTFMLVLLSGYVGLRSVFDAVRGVNLVENGRLAGAIGGMFGNPNDLATNMVVFLPFALLWGVRPAPTWKRLAAGFCALMMMATIVFTQSRAGSLGLVTMMFVLVVSSVRVKPIIAVATIAGVLAALPVAPPKFWNRIISIVDKDKDDTGSRQARIDLMKEALHVYLEHPIVGVGVGQFPNYNPDGRVEKWRETHNALLEVATEEGTLGLIPFVFLIYCGIQASREARRRLLPRRGRLPVRSTAERRLEPENDHEALLATATAAQASMAGWFVCAFFASIALSWTIYYLLAIAVCTRDIVRARQLEQAEPALARVS